MECTQRLECTQDLYDSPVEKTCPEQIGFLGICGTKYPVKRGPNKVGRDPQTCSIVLQLESISRQHAVINVLNQAEFMLMDLDSANKTKLSGKTLQPYIPHPLTDGDMVQFGKVFGVFRLLEDRTELPMTQALDIPDTPVAARHIARLNHAAVTTIPESPEVSDRDDSFIAPSQPKLQKQFKDEASHFIKPSAKTISIQPIGSKKIDNVYWNSSNRSTSIGSMLDDSTKSMNDSAISLNKSSDMNLHEMETQAPTENVQNISVDSIYTANTQMPNECNQIINTETIYNANTQMSNTDKHNVSVDSIFTANTQLPNMCSPKVTLDSVDTANTQIPDKCNASPSIHNADTQMPEPDNLPSVCKVQNQHEMQFDFFVANKENDNNLFNAETQAFVPNNSTKPESLCKAIKNINTDKDHSKSSLHTSEEEILFEDIDKECFQDVFESQSLLPESPQKLNENNKDAEDDSDFEITLNKAAKRTIRIKSDSSTDCEDIEIVPTQQLPIKPDDDEITDCEDSFNDDFKKPENFRKSNAKFEEMLTQVIVHEEPSKKNNNNNLKYGNLSKLPTGNPKVLFEDMLTQVIQDDNPLNTTAANDLNFEDMPTQVICNDKELHVKVNLEDLPTQVLHEDIFDKVKGLKVTTNDFKSPFKVPLKSPRKSKRKDTPKLNQSTEVSPVEVNPKNGANIIENDDNYYEATQDIMADLCSQAQLSPEILPIRPDDDIVPSSVEDYKTGDVKLPGLDYDVSPKSSDSNIEEKLNNFVTSLSKEQIRDVIGVQTLKRQPSGSQSDGEATPKKVHPMKLFEMDLPNSQEIKTSVSLHYQSNVTETSSESETENENTEDQFTPILYRKKKKPKIDAKLDLTKRLDVHALPSRVSTRVRKPAAKVQETEINKRNDNFLKPNYLTEQEGDISNEIIIENITRLKTKNEKNKSNTEVSNENQKSNNDSKLIVKSVNKTELNLKDKRKSDELKESDTKDKQKAQELKKEPNTKSKRKSDDSKKEKASVPKMSKSETLTSIDLTSERSKRSTRSTRYKVKESDKSKEKRTESIEKVKDKKVKKDDDKRRHRISKKEDKHEPEETKEVRRSRRQKSYKEKKENDSLIKVKIMKPAKKDVKSQIQHESSAVYSVSSESGPDSPQRLKRPESLKRPDSPQRLKRPASEPLRAPSPKRTRAAARATPAPHTSKQKVLFTAFPFEEVRNKLESLGAEIVSDVTQCTVLVTLHIKRTFKLLCAVGLGRPIVGCGWVQACHDNNTIVDPWLHLLKDEQAEQKFKFSLQRTLSGKRGFLRGYNVTSTPQVKPATAEMMLIVECSGGTWAEGGPRWLCVSCSADRALWPGLRQRGAELVSSELVLAGVLRQALDIDGTRLH